MPADDIGSLYKTCPAHPKCTNGNLNGETERCGKSPIASTRVPTGWTRTLASSWDTFSWDTFLFIARMIYSIIRIMSGFNSKVFT